MAMQSARMQINGTWHNLKFNSANGKWEASITAPSVTSFNLSGGYYPATVEATNEVGTSTTITATDPNLGPDLRLVVNEIVKPTVAITSPGAGSYLANNQTPITFTLRDETNGSGVKANTFSFVLDGVTLTNTSPGMSLTAATGGYNGTYAPPAAMSDGPHSVSITVQDNDGNISTAATLSYTIDTVPPILNITSPADGLKTATAAQTVRGTTNDATSSAVVVKIGLNGTDQGTVTVGGDGSFSKSITLAEGNNTITVTSTDLAGKVTTVTLGALLDTTAPVVRSINISPNPIDAGQTFMISVEIE